jgi:tRNA A58 N-methylase Trm61
MKPRQSVDPRLRELAYEILEPYSQGFLIQSGLCEGLRVLEFGCGAGSMTPWLSQMVGMSGRVVALDNLHYYRSRRFRLGNDFHS